jgi:hypothetical protein
MLALQGTDGRRQRDPHPDLASYDLFVADISGGKDSQEMLRKLVSEVTAAGISTGRIVCVFADLAILDYRCPVPLWGSGLEAAAHGVLGIAQPTQAARGKIKAILRLRARRNDDAR